MLKTFLKCSWPILILSGLLCIAFYDVVFLNKTFKVTTANSQALPTGAYGQQNNKPAFIPVNGTDTPVLEEPIYEFVRKNLSRGIFPLWNPHQSCGFPLIGMLQAALFYPLTLILYILPSFVSWDIFILVRLFLGGWFMYLMMRHFHYKQAPSLLSGICFMLSGPMLLLQYWTANVDILLPLLIIVLDRMIKNPGPKRIVETGSVMGLTILGGHPEHILLVNAFGFAFFLFRSLSYRNTDYKKIAILYTFSCLLAAALSAIALLPFIQNFLTEFWHGHPSGTGLLMEEQRERAITLALPHFFQKAPITYDWTFAGWWGGYLGLLPLALAFFSLFQIQRNGLNYFFVGLAFLIIGKEYGLPVINWIGHLPLLNLPRYAIHSPPLAAFAISAAAGMGLRLIQTRRLLLKPLIIFILLIGTIIISHLVILRSAPHFDLSLKAALFAGALLSGFSLIIILKMKGLLSHSITGLLILGLVAFELFCYIHRERPNRFDSFPEVPYINALKNHDQPVRAYGNFWAFYPNTATGFEVDDLGFFFGLVPKRFVSFVNTLLIPDHFRKDFRSPSLRAIPIQNKDTFLDLLNVRYFILPADDTLIRHFPHFEHPNERFPEVYKNEVRMYERPGAFPRAFLTQRVVFTENDEEELAFLKKLRGALHHVAIVHAKSDAHMLSKLKNNPIKKSGNVAITYYSPNRVEIKTSTSSPEFLVMSDAYHPDWKAFIDQKPATLYRTDHMLRGVFVPKGTHTITFLFKPFWFCLGLILSLLSWGSVIFVFLYKKTRQ